MITRIHGKTIDLQLLEASDIEQLREWRNSSEVSDFMLSRDLISKEQQEKWFQKIKTDPTCSYWMILSKVPEKLGVANFVSINNDDHSAEPGLYIGKKEHRNSFYGTEAYYYLLDYGFTHLGLEKVYGTVLSDNIAAVKMNTSFGFDIESILKDHIMIDGVGRNLFKIVLYKHEFYQSKMAAFFKRR